MDKRELLQVTRLVLCLAAATDLSGQFLPDYVLGRPTLELRVVDRFGRPRPYQLRRIVTRWSSVDIAAQFVGLRAERVGMGTYRATLIPLSAEKRPSRDGYGYCQDKEIEQDVEVTTLRHNLVVLRHEETCNEMSDYAKPPRLVAIAEGSVPCRGCWIRIFPVFGQRYYSFNDGFGPEDALIESNGAFVVRTNGPGDYLVSLVSAEGTVRTKVVRLEWDHFMGRQPLRVDFTGGRADSTWRWVQFGAASLLLAGGFVLGRVRRRARKAGRDRGNEDRLNFHS